MPIGDTKKRADDQPAKIAQGDRRLVDGDFLGFFRLGNDSLQVNM